MVWWCKWSAVTLGALLCIYVVLYELLPPAGAPPPSWGLPRISLDPAVMVALLQASPNRVSGANIAYFHRNWSLCDLDCAGGNPYAIAKVGVSPAGCEHVRRDVWAQLRLQTAGVTPQLLAYLPEACLVIWRFLPPLTDTLVSSSSMDRQGLELVCALERAGVSHNDIKPSELRVDTLSNRLVVVDFGWATYSAADRYRSVKDKSLIGMWADDQTAMLSTLADLSLKRTRVFFQQYVMNHTDPLVAVFRPPELHCFVSWNTTHTATFLRMLRTEFPTLVVQGETHRGTDDQRTHLYRLLTGSNDVSALVTRGSGDFDVIVVEDAAPEYGWRCSASGAQVCNVGMHAAKTALRQAVPGDYLNLHGSFNVQETLQVLTAIQMAHLAPRRNWASLRELFHELDRHNPFAYVVQRSFDNVLLPTGGRNIWSGYDVDVLVNDYYLFKAITGARSSNEAKMRERNEGPNVLNTILIAGNELGFDVRWVGDGYLDPRWQATMLRDRVRKRYYFTDECADSLSILTPSPPDYFYSLLYYVLVQKQAPHTVKHYTALEQAGREVGLSAAFCAYEKREACWRLLESFLSRMGYHYTPPRDPTVHYMVPPHRPFQQQAEQAHQCRTL